MHACELLHAQNEKFYRGINYFRGGPNISEIFGPGGPNIMGSKYSVTVQKRYAHIIWYASEGGFCKRNASFGRYEMKTGNKRPIMHA